MNAVSQILGALIEAWGEVKVQKARVVLSLVGVVAAVAAMTIVIALGDLLLQSSRELAELYNHFSLIFFKLTDLLIFFNKLFYFIFC